AGVTPAAVNRSKKSLRRSGRRCLDLRKESSQVKGKKEEGHPHCSRPGDNGNLTGIFIPTVQQGA
ncbi:MAG: hypothetical protein FWH27_18685, partial [Planctomycetaceae bacterium]|nr:hypothetical protein [Planctomycetaceae bacterium]